MDTMTLTIDDQQVQAKPGITVLEAATGAGIYIPTLCYHPSLSPYGGCRLCVVEIEKMRGFPTACTTPAGDGMVVILTLEYPGRFFTICLAKTRRVIETFLPLAIILDIVLNQYVRHFNSPFLYFASYATSF